MTKFCIFAKQDWLPCSRKLAIEMHSQLAQPSPQFKTLLLSTNLRLFSWRLCLWIPNSYSVQHFLLFCTYVRKINRIKVAAYETPCLWFWLVPVWLLYGRDIFLLVASAFPSFEPFFFLLFSDAENVLSSISCNGIDCNFVRQRGEELFSGLQPSILCSVMTDGWHREASCCRNL